MEFKYLVWRPMSGFLAFWRTIEKITIFATLPGTFWIFYVTMWLVGLSKEAKAFNIEFDIIISQFFKILKTWRTMKRLQGSLAEVTMDSVHILDKINGNKLQLFSIIFQLTEPNQTYPSGRGLQHPPPHQQISLILQNIDNFHWCQLSLFSGIAILPWKYFWRTSQIGLRTIA